MLVVGLTGGTASGKSLVGRELMRMGAELLDCDEIVHKLYEGENVRKKIIAEFGEGVASERETINRKKLASIVFNDRKKLKRLNSIVHPLVFEEVEKKIDELKKRNFGGIVVVEVALLFESGMQKFFDRTIAVTSPKEQRLERLLSQGISKDDAESRIISQMSDEEKVKLADYVIVNDKGIEKLMAETKNLYKKLEELI